MLLRIVPLLCATALCGLAVASEVRAAESPAAGTEATAAMGPTDSEKLVTATFSVADLVVPIPRLVAVSLTPAAAGPSDPEVQSPEFEPLIETITETIQPESWKSHGGCGSIEFHPKTLSLVVTHTRAVHEKIADRLEQLRRQRDVQVSVEVRCVTMADAVLERIPEECRENGGRPVLESKACGQILKAIQADARSNILSAPRMTLFDEQTLWLSGIHGGQADSLVLNSSVSPNRRNISLSFATAGESDGAPVTLNETVRVPDGRTLAVDCGAVPEANAGVPIVQKLPYAARLFANRSTPGRPMRKVLLITPRIIVPEEEEELLGVTRVVPGQN